MLSKLKSRGFRETMFSTYDFSTVYTTIPHNLTKEKLDLIEWTFNMAGTLMILSMTIYRRYKDSFTSIDQRRYKLWSCQNVCGALSYLLDKIYIKFGTKLYRQIVGIPIGTDCAPIVADLFLFCYERDFMISLSGDVIEAFKEVCCQQLADFNFLFVSC